METVWARERGAGWAGGIGDELGEGRGDAYSKGQLSDTPPRPGLGSGQRRGAAAGSGGTASDDATGSPPVQLWVSSCSSVIRAPQSAQRT